MIWKAEKFKTNLNPNITPIEKKTAPIISMVPVSSVVCVTLWTTEGFYAAERQRSAPQADKGIVYLIRPNLTLNQMLIR